MKKIILSESKFLNLLFESSGYVEGFDSLINFIIKKYTEHINQYKEYVDNKKYDLIEKCVIYSYELSNLLPNNIKIKNIIIIPNENTSFNVGKSEYVEKFNMFNWVVLTINPLLCFGNIVKFRRALQHEFTHVYEYLQKFTKNGYEHSINDLNRKYYNFNDRNNNIVSKLSYMLNQSEINAQISELYTELVDEGMYGKYAYQWLHNTNIGKTLNELEELKNRFKNEPDLTYQVMMFIIKNPQHSDMFPKVRNNSPQAMQKRIVNAIDDKIKKIYQKVDKIIKKVNEHFM